MLLCKIYYRCSYEYKHSGIENRNYKIFPPNQTRSEREGQRQKLSICRPSVNIIHSITFLKMFFHSSMHEDYNYMHNIDYSMK